MADQDDCRQGCKEEGAEMKKEFAISAFARPRSEDADYEYHAQSGMDLRDYFAAKAMQALIDNDGLFSEIPTQAYEMADAMMKARKA